MTKISTLVLIFFFYCNAMLFAGTIDTIYFTQDGAQRSALIYLPDGHSNAQAYPLIVGLHGAGSSAAEFLNYFENPAYLDTYQYIMVCPNAKWDETFGQVWNLGTGFFDTFDDVAFIDLIIQTVKETYYINTNKTYMTGFSMGSMMTQKYNCDRPGVVRAMATAGGTMTVNAFNDCSNAAPTPFLYIHGTADLTVLYGGGNYLNIVNYTSAVTTVNFWLNENRNDCANPPNVTITGNPNLPFPYNLMEVKRKEYKDCNNGCENEVIFFEYVGHNHTWPNPSLPPQNSFIDASKEVLHFFDRHGDCPTVGIKDQLSELMVEVFPNPTSNVLYIKHQFSESPNLKLFDLNGKLLLEQNNVDSFESINIENLTSGCYFLQFTIDNQSTYKKISVW